MWPSVHSVLPIALAALLAGAVVVYFYREHIREKKLRLRVQKFYASQLFEDITPMVRFARHHAVEQVTVDKTGLVMRLLPTGQETAFLMRPNGYNYLTVEQQEAMRAVMEECIPKLCDNEHYRVTRKRNVLLNGDIEYAYQYTISNAYKARLARAPYYDGSLGQRSW